MKSCCDDCQHSHICKYKADYMKTLDEVNIKVSEPFKLTLSCPHYFCTNTYLQGLCSSTYGTTNGYDDRCNTLSYAQG